MTDRGPASYIPTFDDPPWQDEHDEVRRILLENIRRVRREEANLIEHIAQEGRREDIAEVLASQGQRISDLESILLAIISDEELEAFLPDDHPLNQEAEAGGEDEDVGSCPEGGRHDPASVTYRQPNGDGIAACQKCASLVLVEIAEEGEA